MLILSVDSMALHGWLPLLPCPPTQMQSLSRQPCPPSPNQGRSSGLSSVLATLDSCLLLKEQLFNTNAEHFLKTYRGFNLDAKTGPIVDCLHVTLRCMLPARQPHPDFPLPCHKVKFDCGDSMVKVSIQ